MSAAAMRASLSMFCISSAHRLGRHGVQVSAFRFCQGQIRAEFAAGREGAR